MHEGQDLAQHVNIFNQIITDLTQLDVKIEDEDKTMILLCSLPSSYEHMVTTLTYKKETIKVEEITAALLAHNQRRQNTGESSHVDGLYVKGNHDRGRKLENESSERWNSRSKSRGKKTFRCYKCKESGHMREWFSTYMSVNSGFVYLGDDRCCNIASAGEVRIKIYDSTIRTLCDVRHISDFKKNLFLGTLHKNGLIPKADEDREIIRIVKGALTVMKGKITVGNIYKLLRSAVVCGTHSVESDDDNTKLWHMRLGHLSERGMVELHKINLLHDVKSCKLDFCEFCVLETFFSVKDATKNGVAERMNISLAERARCLRLNAGLPNNFWIEAVSMACYLINRSPQASLGGKVVEEQGYDEKVLDMFGMSKEKPVNTPLENHFNLFTKQCPKIDKKIEEMAKVPYASAIGCLMYVMVHTADNPADMLTKPVTADKFKHCLDLLNVYKS
ncbi:hypothetical protein HRI_003799800 [Hibiscus trionum]|uniref:GAG-pre-integrase domain-containing protein n=1 Tax=Hibiscus trionum TaxID=183268 RepID=A0A9W7ITI3_HIBTR|nr:hypothetical protein HRI_003799800 [Hibiscus trionum]